MMKVSRIKVVVLEPRTTAVYVV